MIEPMTRRFAMLALLVAIAGTHLGAQRPAERNTSAAGIPLPSFGLTEAGGDTTHYVNSGHPNASDEGNPNGTPDRPRTTIPTRVPAGSVIEVRGGPYNVGSTAWGGEGTSQRPIVYRGVGDPVIRGADVSFTTSYVIVDGFVFDGLQVIMPRGSSFIALRNSIVRNWSPSTPSAAIVPTGSDLVILGNEIANNGNARRATELDIHGIKPEVGAERVWILNNNIHENGGDGIQVGNAMSGEPWPRYVYIARNTIHEDRENAVDVKKSRDVIVSTNLLYGYEARDSSAGEVVVTHDGAERIWIVDNVLGAARAGIVCTGAAGYVVAGNVINGIVHNPADRGYDAGSLFGSWAILTYNTTGAAHVHNTIWSSDGGISYARGTAATEISNNIIGPLTQSTAHIAIGESGAVSGSRIAGNLITTEPRVRLGGGVAGCPDRDSCFQADASLVNPPQDFRLRPGSPAVDAAVSTPVFDAFRSAYNLSLLMDLFGITRPQGRGMDIGAAELRSRVPTAPKRPRIVGGAP
jgi:hypothetical protein